MSRYTCRCQIYHLNQDSPGSPATTPCSPHSDFGVPPQGGTCLVTLFRQTHLETPEPQQHKSPGSTLDITHYRVRFVSCVVYGPLVLSLIASLLAFARGFVKYSDQYQCRIFKVFSKPLRPVQLAGFFNKIN